VIRPRPALLPGNDSRQVIGLGQSGGESEIVGIGVSLVPRFRSLSNSGRTAAHPGPDVETDQPLAKSHFKQRRRLLGQLWRTLRDRIGSLLDHSWISAESAATRKDTAFLRRRHRLACARGLGHQSPEPPVGLGHQSPEPPVGLEPPSSLLVTYAVNT